MGAYVAIVAFGSYQHVVWRDEVRALSIACDGSLSDLFGRLRNEGHPALWYLLLHATASIVPAPAALKIVSVAVAAAAVFVFVRHGPFSPLERALYVFGLFPLYEYSVQCRNYGLGMLFVWLACACYRDRRCKPIRLGVVLLLLANTSVYGMILAGGLLAGLLVEFAVERAAPGRRAMAGLALAGFGILAAVWVAMPDSSTRITSVPGAAEVVRTGFTALLSQGSFAHEAFGLRYGWLVTLVVLATYALLGRNPGGLCFLILSVLGLDWFHRLVYEGSALRHQGFVFLAFLAAVWLARLTAPAAKNFRTRGFAVLVPLLLLLQVFLGVRAFAGELQTPRSSARRFAELVRADEALSDAILVTEPDYMAESFPYYLPNRLYFPREGRFGTTVSFTSRNVDELSIGQLLDTARELKRSHGVPVIIVLAHPLQRDGSIRFSYGKEFSYTGAETGRFIRSTIKLAALEFALTDEKYAVYLLR